MLTILGYHSVCVRCRNRVESSRGATWKHFEAPIRGVAWLFRGVPDSWDSWQRLKARRGRMRKPTGRHRSDGSSASDSPRATYARVLVRSLARLIIQLISPGRSPHLRLALPRATSYVFSILPNKLRRICSECNSWYSRALKRVTVARQRSSWFCENFNFKITVYISELCILGMYTECLNRLSLDMPKISATSKINCGCCISKMIASVFCYFCFKFMSRRQKCSSRTLHSRISFGWWQRFS